MNIIFRMITNNPITNIYKFHKFLKHWNQMQNNKKLIKRNNSNKSNPKKIKILMNYFQI